MFESVQRSYSSFCGFFSGLEASDGNYVSISFNRVAQEEDTVDMRCTWKNNIDDKVVAWYYNSTLTNQTAIKIWEQKKEGSIMTTSTITNMNAYRKVNATGDIFASGHAIRLSYAEESDSGYYFCTVEIHGRLYHSNQEYLQVQRK